MQMKTPKQHLINIITAKGRGLMLLLIGLAFSLTGFGQEEGTQYSWDLRISPIVFKSNGTVTYNGSTYTHNSDNTYTITTEGVATTNTITIETVNLVPTGASNQDMTYNITLDNVYIDRSGITFEQAFSEYPNASGNHRPFYHSIYQLRWYYNHGTLLPFNAGDDTVNVNVTLVGENTLKGEPGHNAVMQYNRYDGSVVSLTLYGGTHNPVTKGVVGEGTLTIKGAGSLTLEKEGHKMDSGPCLGACELYTGTNASKVDNISSGHICIDLEGTLTANVVKTDDNASCSYGSAIGAGACTRSGMITINSGTVIARSYATAAAIGGGGGNSGLGADASGAIIINGGTVKTYSGGNDLTSETGIGIGGGSSNKHRGGNAEHIEINGGSIEAWKWVNGAWQMVGMIGGGHSNMTENDYPEHAGYANIFVNGGSIKAGVVGGGSCISSNSDGNGGYVKFTMTGGNLEANKIGGGNCTQGTGGNISVIINGGTIKCTSITAGNATTGTPGSIVGEDIATAGLQISEISILKPTNVFVGHIAGGTNSAGSWGYVTANISGGLIQGQFVLTAKGSTHSYFRMTGGIIDNTGLGVVGASDYPRLKEDGGAVYMDDASGEITFSGGTIKNCANSTNGGAFYMTGGTLNLNGGTITGCTATSKGGAVYFSNGTVNVGATDSTPLIVRGNTVNSISNNIYLPSSKTITIIGDNFDPQDVGIYTESTANEVRVLSSSNATWISNLYSAISADTKNLFPDRTEYKVKPYVSGTDLYFTKASPWSAMQQEATPAANLHLVGDVYEIYNVKDLTAFLWHVNGITTHGDFGSDQTAKGKLMADIDMDGHYWVPIGTNFTGEFDGNGYTIKNLDMSRSNPSDDRGLFGTVGSGGVIKNVQLVDCYFSQGQDDSYVGGIISKMNGGTLSNSNVNGLLVSFNNTCTLGGLVGQQTGGNIHSSFATAELKGYLMGGLVGTMASGTTLKNSFANAKFTIQSGSTEYVGGLVGENAGTVENCYVRMQNATNPSATYFGYLAGTNSIESTNGTLQYCYSPASPYVSSDGTAGTQTGLGTYGTTVRLNDAYRYLHRDQQIAPENANSHVFNGTFSSTTGLTGLLATLNHWVESNSTYSKWMRTSASPINDDYPIFNYDNRVCVGSIDNNNLEYSNDFSTLFTTYLGGNSDDPGVGTIYLYKNAGTSTITASNSGKATELYIGEDAVLLHNSAINAHVGVTLDNSAGIAEGGANPSFGGSDVIDWHFFSSVLQAAPIGLSYPAATPSYNTEPGQATFTAENAADGYFPTNLDSYYADWDLYGYCEPEYHWINYKRNSNNHWHEDWPDCPITYTNHTIFKPGYGYMVALAHEGYMQGCGTLNTHSDSAPLEVDIDYNPDVSWSTREGQNLLGNPYQSYLDFNAFVDENRGLWTSGTPFYIIMDEDKEDYVIYAYTASYNADAQASRYIHPHQGFMIKAETSGKKAKFHDGMRTTTMESSWTSSFRDGGSQSDYPLVNLFAKDKNGNRDIVTVELGRPEKGGVPKAQVPGTSTGRISCHYDDENYALAFTEPGLDVANIRFVTEEDGEYTMTWSTHNGEFSYLHLIDNKAGKDIDCLQETEYTFTSKTTDYASRFRLVFDYTGIEEQEDAEHTEGPTTFAYYANGEIHLFGTTTGTARLEIIDMTGRTVASRDAVPAFATLSTDGMAAGVYILRLTDRNGTRTQKMVIQ